MAGSGINQSGSTTLNLSVPGKGVALLEMDTGNGQVSHPLLRLVVGLVLPLLLQHLCHQDGHQVFLNISKVLSLNKCGIKLDGFLANRSRLSSVVEQEPPFLAPAPTSTPALTYGNI